MKGKKSKILMFENINEQKTRYGGISEGYL